MALFAALAALVGSVAVAACGGDDDADTGNGASGTVDSEEAREFRDLVGLTDDDVDNLQGEQLRVGAVLPLSGPGSEYGTAQGEGLELALKHMEDFVGLDVEYEPKDHQSGDPQAGARAARQLGVDGFGIAVNSYYAVFGATLPEVQQYQMLSFDPGGGTGNGLKGENYFWGLRANTPDDGFASLTYFAETQPDLERVALVIWDAGEEYYGPIEDNFETAVEENGMEYVGRELQPIGATDNAAIISGLRGKNPDLVWLVSYGVDPGHFMRQYVDAGIDAQVVGAEFTQDAVDAAGQAYEEYMFAADYFDVDSPPNPLSEFFIEQYEQENGEKPYIFYQPNYYEAGLALLVLAARVAADGGDINDGTTLQEALVADPTLPSVYGGSEDEVGRLVLSDETHDPIERPVGLFRAGPPIEQIAEFNIGGTDFQVLKE